MSRWRASPYIALAPALLGVFIAADDQTVIVTVLPEIMFDLGVQVTELERASWAITGYLLGYVAAMPLVGRMSDVWGRRSLFAASMLAFMAGSAAAAMTTSITWLVVARVFQAVGAGAMLPISIAIVGDSFPPHRRGVPLGLVGAAAEAGGVIGPLWGGLISRFLDWTWVFWINLPLGALTLFALFALLGGGARRRARVDYLGGALLAVSLSALTLALARIDSPDALLAVWLAVALVSFALFVVRQRLAADPLLPVSMFRAATFVSANLTHLMVGGALIIGMVAIPLMANTALGWTPLDGGLMLMRMTVAMPFGALAGGWLSQRAGYRLPSMIGLALAAVGFWRMSGWGLDVADPWMTAHLATAGFGFGLLIAPVALAATESVGEDLRGAAAGVVAAMRVIGMTFGLAALAAWGVGRFQQLVVGIELPLPAPGETAAQTQARVAEFEASLIDAGVSLFNDFFLIAMAVSLAAIGAAAFMKRTRADG